MLWKNTNEKYGVIARFLHGLVSILVLLQLAGGFWFMNSPADLKAALYALHKISGLLILILMMIRLSWRMANVLPTFPYRVSEKKAIIARSVHRLFYVLLLLMPLSGWAMATLSGYPPVIPGMGPFNFPLLTKQTVCVFGTPYTLIKIMALTHFYTACTLLVFLAMHIGVGISHAIKGDGVLDRMFFPKD